MGPEGEEAVSRMQLKSALLGKAVRKELVPLCCR